MHTNDLENNRRPSKVNVRLSVPFFIAVGALALTEVVIGPVAGWTSLRTPKLALPLRAPLSTLNESVLLPYRVVERQTLEAAVIDALGTDQYIDWWLENPTASANDPLRYAHLFITYDSGGTNLVPHTPDECRLGAGYQFAREPENREISLSQLQGKQSKAKVRLCTFLKTAVFNSQEDSVVYTFCANGQIVATRNDVRLLINDPKRKYAYFSKVELSFPKATREQTLSGVTNILNGLLPALMRDHWPDIDAAEAAASAAAVK